MTVAAPPADARAPLTRAATEPGQRIRSLLIGIERDQRAKPAEGTP